MPYAIIVEGKNDRRKLRKLLSNEVIVTCTHGTPSAKRIEELKEETRGRHIFIFTDNDASGRKIRGILREIFPEAEQIYTKKGFFGVEGTPDDYLIQQLEKAGLEPYIRYPQSFCNPFLVKEFFEF